MGSGNKLKTWKAATKKSFYAQSMKQTVPNVGDQ